MKSQGIKHIRSAPYHPATNAERFIETLKQGGKMAGQIRTSYRASYLSIEPHHCCDWSELLMGRPLKTVLQLLKPDVNAEVLGKQSSQKKSRWTQSHSSD